MFDWFQMDQSTVGHFEKLCEIVGRLRAPGGCPWDREQTHESLLPAIIEEAYEVVEAARTGNDAHFCEELGASISIKFFARSRTNWCGGIRMYLAPATRAIPAPC